MKQILVILLLTLTLLSCQKEFDQPELQKQPTNTSNLKTYYICGSNARLVANKLAKNLGKTISSGKGTSFAMRNGIEIDYDSIMVVENDLHDIAYTFKVNSAIESETTFQNIAYIQKTTGTSTKLITYSMDADFAADYKADRKSMTQFKGTIHIIETASESCCLTREDLLHYPYNTSNSGSSGSNGGWDVGSSGGSTGNTNSGSELCQSGQHIKGDPDCAYTTDTSLIISNRSTASGNANQVDPNLALCCIFDIGIYDDVIFKNDCEKLKSLVTATGQNIKPDMDWLATKLNDPNNTVEHGIEFKRPLLFSGAAGYQNNQVSSVNSNNVELTADKRFTGGAHIHTPDGYSIPSFGDLRCLLKMYEQANDEFKQDIVYMLMCKDKITGQILNYALKVNDIDWLRNQVNDVWNNPIYAVPNTGNQEFDDDAKMDKIHKELAKGYEANKNNLEKYFLQKYGSGSFNLYKATDANLDNWDKLETGTDPLSANPTQLIVNKIPCP